MPAEKEIEFKFAVADESAFAALLRALELPEGAGRSVRQVNHFFDTAHHALWRNALALRLRDEEGAFWLTLKGDEKTRSADGILTERMEVEVEVAPELARLLLAGSVSPGRILADAGEEVAQLRMDAALAGAEPRPVGRFENERTRLPPVDLGGGLGPVRFELDRTRFPDGRIDCEIEVEAADVELKALRTRLDALLARAGIAWSHAPSKARRFFELLERGSRP
jgi:inorganic triphosphatase YgiF